VNDYFRILLGNFKMAFDSFLPSAQTSAKTFVDVV